MNKKFGLCGRLLFFPLVFAAILCSTDIAYGQQSAIVARMLFPPRNYEIALGDTVTPLVRIWNTDTVAHSGMRIQYRITNVVYNIPIYSNPIVLPSIAPGDSLDTTFEPYISNPNTLSELGTFKGCLFAGDTNCSLLFGIRRITTPFFDPSDNYGSVSKNELTSTSFDIPDQTMWVSVGATVVDGDVMTWDPPPPRNPDGGYGSDTLVSPAIRLDRNDFTGNFYSGNDVGDTLTSFPINLQGKTRVDFSFDYMRAGKLHYPLNWDLDTMLGPESTILNSQTGQVDRVGDSLILEFRNPSQSVLNPSPDGWDEIAAIDGGRDFEFKSFYAESYDTNAWKITLNGITKTITNTPNYFTADFRFRFRLKAKSDAVKSSIDDADQWYIDNPTVQVPLLPQVEVSWVRVVNPYTKVPLSQAVFPVDVGIFNNLEISVNPSPSFNVQIIDPRGDTVYSETAELGTLPGGSDTVLQFPNWDASGEFGAGSGAFTAIASLQPYYQSNQSIVQTYTKFYLNVETGPAAIQEFALDDAGLTPQTGSGNDIPKLTGIQGGGIGFNGGNGSFAMKFQLARTDTLYGVRIYFGSANQSPDEIRISLYNGDANTCTPLDLYSQPGTSTLESQRGGDFFDQFWPYYFPTPTILKSGTYWISVSQLGLNNMELGADISRGGAEVVGNDPLAITPQISAVYGPSSPDLPWYGTQWGSGPDDNNGAVSCSYAVEIIPGSGAWQPLMPGDGLWPAMATGDALQPQLSMPSQLIGVGTYAPMIRPIIGQFSPSSVQASPVLPILSLEQNFPNPFDPTATSTTISFSLPDESPVSLTICNILGDVVKTLENSNMPAGTHTVSWDGRDENGAIVPAGAYLISLESAGHRATAKMIVTE